MQDQQFRQCGWSSTLGVDTRTCGLVVQAKYKAGTMYRYTKLEKRRWRRTCEWSKNDDIQSQFYTVGRNKLKITTVYENDKENEILTRRIRNTISLQFICYLVFFTAEVNNGIMSQQEAGRKSTHKRDLD